MKQFTTLALALLLLLMPLYATAQQEALKFESIAEIETSTKNQQGEAVVVRKPAGRVIPGTTVIYTNSLTNQGEVTLEAPVIDNPVPESTEYLADSARGEGTSITFSVDGGASYDVPEKLIVTGADGQPAPAAPRDYTHIRWQFSNDLPPQGTARVEFRVKVK